MKSEHPISRIPRRTFLDTCTVNFILDYGESIFEGEAPDTNCDKKTLEDIDAFYNIFLVGVRAHWELAISPFVYNEVMATPNSNKRYYLSNWFNEIWVYWRDIMTDDPNLPIYTEAEDQKKSLLCSGDLKILPDIGDRELLCDAVIYKCDSFCTRDIRTIVKYRDRLTNLPITIITPSEWWKLIQPFARLWA